MSCFIRMPPQPNTHAKDINIETLVSSHFVDGGMNDELSDSSDDINDESAQYAGYQLLQQNEFANGYEADDQSSNSDDEIISTEDVFNENNLIDNLQAANMEEEEMNIDYTVSIYHSDDVIY